MKKTPIIRKLIYVGNSKAVTIPPSWLKNIEKTTGNTVTELFMEINGQITIKPVLEKTE